ncbi:MAG: hypothetical protein WC943_04960, partial [Elusimicrobiota bacterium]
MREQELRKVIEEVVRALAAKGLVDDRAGAPAERVGGPPKPVTTTIGTAGKVFSSEYGIGFKAGAGAPLPKDDDGCATGCRGCGGKSGPGECVLQSSGADRFGVCQPTKQCSKVARMC